MPRRGMQGRECECYGQEFSPLRRTTRQVGDFAVFLLERRPLNAYCRQMVDNMFRSDATAGWLEDLAESEAELAAGLTVSGE